MTEILCVIPARAGSKRIPDKNIKPLNGKPLIYYTILTATSCELIDHVVVSSDIPSLDGYEADYGHLSYHRRPDYLCGDKVPDIRVIRDVITEYGDKWDLIVYLRPTTPFRNDHHITRAIEQMLAADVNATGLRSVEEMSESAFKCFTMPAFLSPITYDGKDLTDQPNQMVTPTYRPNGYIDICKPEIVKKGGLWGDWVIGYVTPRTIEIDTLEDWKYAEWAAKKFVEAPMRFGRREI